ncbi:MAG: hypothetical protein HYW02_07305 [Deltaproteobacteria bacterium]|nr:hypothetical protein [Deltaproteobacteria bacterium]MBI2501246.1 hypothetical protein [Deltaproteobacteria bacterium]
MRLLLLGFFLLSLASPVWGKTPSLSELHQETLRVAGYDRHEIYEWKQKSRWAAALPRLQVGFDRQLKDVVKLTTEDTVSVSGGSVQVGPDENKFDQDFQQGFGIDVRAVWYLDQLVFSENRIEVSRETRSWIQERGRLLERVTDLYMTWRHEKDQRKREQLSGYLDAYTDGWFSRAWRER